MSLTQSRPRIFQMPPEVLHQIFQYLDQPNLLNLLRIHSTISNAAMVHLYKTPKFATSFRLAQFACTVSSSVRHSNMVRAFLLPASLTVDTKQGLAGWREFKYRKQPVYGPVPSEDADKSHPKRARILTKYRPDVPYGLVLQVLISCEHIR